MEPKTKGFKRTEQRVCCTCRSLLGMGGKYACQHLDNAPMGDGMPPVCLLDTCDRHEFYSRGGQ